MADQVVENQDQAACIQADASSLVAWCLERGIIAQEDSRWAYNRILEDIGASGPGPLDGMSSITLDGFDLDACLDRLAGVAIRAGLAEDTVSGRDRMAMRITGSVMARPSEVSNHFWQLYHSYGPQAATDWFYQLSCDVNYVRRSAIARNLAWKTHTRWGDLEITINKSKPEKDPRDIAAAGHVSSQANYPACALCRENEGYPGRAASDAGGHSARQNLRIIPLELGGEGWGLQYSPYAYFPEHCIVMSDSHRPMHIDAGTLACLLDFVEIFPHYFIGSNADLPIVGGSILSHDHYQGGRHHHPMAAAPIDEAFSLTRWPEVRCGVLVWPLTVIRLYCDDRDALLACADHILRAWRAWDDPSVGVIARDADGTPHNTVTPICRRRGDSFELDLALRCNITTKDYPLGRFHPHADKWHIKKENIGLIEVMGEAILPARLEGEISRVAELLCEGRSDQLEKDKLCASHAVWGREVLARHLELKGADSALVLSIMREEVGQVFGHVLEDAGVFAWDASGRAALGRFIASL